MNEKSRQAIDGKLHKKRSKDQAVWQIWRYLGVSQEDGRPGGRYIIEIAVGTSVEATCDWPRSHSWESHQGKTKSEES